jgi:16S rRNA (uracil1498-N3)-methyltransferase
LIYGSTFLDSQESNHALRVLRLKPGDELRVTDGQGTFYQCIITGSTNGICSFDIKDKQSVENAASGVHIAMSPTKNHDRVEWFVEKATEIGVSRISFVVCEHSERRKINEDRLQKIAVGAMKQSLKAWLPQIDPLTDFDDILKETPDQKFIAHLDATSSSSLLDKALRGGSSIVLIGPEGDFSTRELKSAEEAHFQKITLGTSRLRTETAALVAATTLALVNR